MTKKVIVQGDVFLVPCEMPENVVSIPKKGKLILAEGEATGHAHTIENSHASLWQDSETLYLSATAEVTLHHQEHRAITIPAGNYKVGIVQEYDYFLEETRKVVD